MTVRYCNASVADIQPDPPVLPPAPCPDALRTGGVVTSVDVAGTLLSLGETYRIVTNDLLARGGDFYESFAEACARAGNFCEDTLMLDAPMDEFENASPVTRSVEGRLVAQ
ncbi:Extracellular glutamate-binding receptor [Thioalkalivibrio nitratireducens DSM 14787]|uniref:Extracellular glutamate-binding receptor n=1 Tax=Thioalkalivibrio nitratireducens (strain DSM 14787 / UNIQEM 213 / ALEN2) TaxID=1255043 RepID=L0DW62_THIND|nr:Extracellular glutamate-binding receptor [Thioalkalivibrio nitratireducens DSM 14787]